MLDLDYTIKVRVPIIVFAVLVTYGTVFWAATPSRKGIGYQPEQPIAFSHKLHAGEMQIDCRYCHVGADKSRHSTVPSIDTCMNCHNTVKTFNKTAGEYHYTADAIVPKGSSLGLVISGIKNVASKHPKLKKKLEAISTIKRNHPEELVEILNSIMNTTVLANAFITENLSTKWEDEELLKLSTSAELKDAMSAKVATDAQKALLQKTVRLMMDEIYPIDNYKSLEIKKLTKYFKGGKTIPWKRVYHLPEYAYFNHSVHVNKGIDCTNCHGDVAGLEKMTKLKPITMGRCIDCHRGDYAEYHSELKEKAVGPENCGACHR